MAKKKRKAKAKKKASVRSIAAVPSAATIAAHHDAASVEAAYAKNLQNLYGVYVTALSLADGNPDAIKAAKKRFRNGLKLARTALKDCKEML